MVESTLALILILVAAAAGLTAMGMAVYMFRAQRKRHDSLDDEDSDTPAGEDEEAESASPHMASNRQQSPKAHSLFVIFPTPDADQKQAVIEWLRTVEARYDHGLEVYTVAGKTPPNPVKIANAFLPGTLPDLLTGQGSDDFELRGLSLLVKPPLRRRRNEQMHVFVGLAKELEAMG
ncbi:MAG: hypothetical protein GX771_09385, partial [Halomonadaceae bacterium]|nr:hypothetical protein [Halomonadaceae bacterium]